MSDTFFLIVGIVLCAVGALSIVSGILSKVKCTEPVEGTVVSLKDKTFYHRGITTHMITPVIKYVYGEKTYESKAANSTSNTQKYRVGDSITVLVDPKAPESFTLKKTIFPYIFGVIMLIPGIVLIWCYYL